MDKTYSAKIAVRNSGRFCVCVPKEFIDDKTLKLGDKVEVTLKRCEHGIES